MRHPLLPRTPGPLLAALLATALGGCASHGSLSLADDARAKPASTGSEVTVLEPVAVPPGTGGDLDPAEAERAASGFTGSLAGAGGVIGATGTVLQGTGEWTQAQQVPMVGPSATSATGALLKEAGATVQMTGTAVEDTLRQLATGESLDALSGVLPRTLSATGDLVGATADVVGAVDDGALWAVQPLTQPVAGVVDAAADVLRRSADMTAASGVAEPVEQVLGTASTAISPIVTGLEAQVGAAVAMSGTGAMTGNLLTATGGTVQKLGGAIKANSQTAIGSAVGGMVTTTGATVSALGGATTSAGTAPVAGSPLSGLTGTVGSVTGTTGLTGALAPATAPLTSTLVGTTTGTLTGTQPTSTLTGAVTGTTSLVTSIAPATAPLTSPLTTAVTGTVAATTTVVNTVVGGTTSTLSTTTGTATGTVGGVTGTVGGLLRTR